MCPHYRMDIKRLVEVMSPLHWCQTSTAKFREDPVLVTWSEARVSQQVPHEDRRFGKSQYFYHRDLEV